jgi:hypothetical protein
MTDEPPPVPNQLDRIEALLHRLDHRVRVEERGIIADWLVTTQRSYSFTELAALIRSGPRYWK